MCNGIAIIAIKTETSINVFCDPENGSHDALLSKYVYVEKHNNYIKIEYIYPGELRLDCPDTECRNAALKTGLVELAGLNDTLRIKTCVLSKIASKMPTITNWPKKLMQGADLSGANLSGANLSGANLSRANLSGANLYEANLSGANLYEADLSGANLSGANLSRANLSRANLYEADLSRANLYGTNLSGANLYEADLSGANLSRADLYGANLSRADLYGANLSRADLYGTVLSDEQKELAKKQGAINI